MKIYALRHGEYEYNVKGLMDYNPKSEKELTKTGITQANDASEKLKDVNFDIVFSSELKRARQTAEIINKNHNTDIITDKRINETKTGFQDGKTSEWLAILSKSNDPWNEKFNDGESFLEEKARIHSFLNELKTKNYKTVLVVAHEATLRVMNLYNGEITPEKLSKFHFHNCEILEFRL